MVSLAAMLSNCRTTSKIGVGSAVNFSIDTLVQPFVDHKDTRALSIAILRDGEPQYFNYGIISSESNMTPTNQTVYEIGSISKTFTTTILAQMVEEQKVKLTDAVSHYFPAGANDWSDDRPVTYLDLATHHSGLPRIPDNLKASYIKNPGNPYANYFEADLLAFINDYNPVEEGKRQISYSNLGVGLLGYLLTRIDDQTDFESLVIKRIFAPLTMNDTYIDAERGDLIPGHDDKGHVVSSWEFPVLAGAGGIRSTSADMLKYLNAHIEGRFAPDILFLPRFDYDDKRKIALGWLLEKDRPIIWHNGGTGVFRSFVGFVKEDKMAVVVLSNTTHSVDDIGFAILSRLMKQD